MPRASIKQEVMAAAGWAVPKLSPATVERLRAPSGKADVYRVSGAGPVRSVVLKLQDAAVCALEERVYREVLARLSVPAIRCHGSVPSQEPNKAWLVMDYVDGEAFDRSSPVHTMRLARWLGTVHADARRVAAPAAFPDHGAEYWRSIVAEAHQTLHAGVENPAVTQRDRDGLVSLADVFGRVLDNWSKAEEWMDTVPRTLTHGDLVSQNIRMCGSTRGQLPSVHDWGAAGWGCPMVDLLCVDLAAYAESLGPDWPESPPSTTRVLRALGLVCWTAFVLIGERESLSSPWPHRAAAKAPVYLRGLTRHGVPFTVGAAS
jgi:hypothetical protein